MIILNIHNKKVNIYPIGKEKGTINTHRKPLFNATFKLIEDNNSFKAVNFKIINSSLVNQRDVSELYDILNKQNIFLHKKK